MHSAFAIDTYFRRCAGNSNHEWTLMDTNEVQEGAARNSRLMLEEEEVFAIVGCAFETV